VKSTNWFATVRAFVTALIQAWNAYHPSRLAAALSYYSMFSLAPALYIAITVARAFLSEAFVGGELYGRLSDMLGPEVVRYIQQLVNAAAQKTSSGATITSLIGAGVMIYAASSLFTQLQYALNVIWQATPESAGVMHFIRNKLVAFVMVMGLGLLLMAASVGSVVVSAFNNVLGLGLSGVTANSAIFFALMALAFTIIYKVLPETKTNWSDMWIGGAVTALLMSIGGGAVGFYLRHSHKTSAFGAASTLAVLLVAVYYMAQIFLFGALFTRVYADTFGSKAVTRQETTDQDGLTGRVRQSE
jgi:membrane protein